MNDKSIGIGYSTMMFDLVRSKILELTFKGSILPGLSSSVLNVKYKGKSIKGANNNANICTARTAGLFLMPAIVTNNGKVVIENFAP